MNLISDFKQWWNRPLKPKDRVHAILIAIVGGFWIGLISGFVFAPSPTPLNVLGYWVFGGIIISTLLAILFPKVITVVLCPLSLFSIGSN